MNDTTVIDVEFTNGTTVNVVADNTTDEMVTLESVFIETSNLIRVSVTEVQIIYMLIGILGIVGNGSSFIVFASSKLLRKNLTNHFLIHQSIIDFVASVFVLATIPLENRGDVIGISGYLLCVFWNTSYMVWATLLVSTYNLVALSIERWLKITKPLMHRVHFTKTTAYIMMILAWIGGFTHHTFLYVATSKVTNKKCYPLKVWSSPNARKAFGVINFTVKLLAPVIIIAFCYIGMIKAINASSKATGRTINNKQDIQMKAQRNVLRTLVVVVICFIFCVIWNQVWFTLFTTGLAKIDFTSGFYHMTVVFYHMNCCINPVIYLFNYRDFRLEARKLICRNKVGPNNSLSVASEAQFASTISKGRSNRFETRKN